MVTTEIKKKETVDIELRQELSDFLAQKFMCRKNCSICWNTGVRVIQRFVGVSLQYTPCTCLVLRKDIKDGKTSIGSTKK